MKLVLASILVFLAATPGFSASLEEARALYQNNLLDDSKKELILLLFASTTTEAEKPVVLYMLGMINYKQGQQALASKYWKDVLDRYPKAAEPELARQNLRQVEPVPRSMTPLPPSRLHLLSPGAEPRHLLQYSPTTAPQKGALRIQMTFFKETCLGGGQPSPEILTADVEFEATSAADADPRILRVAWTGRLTPVVTGAEKAPKISSSAAISATGRIVQTGQTLEWTEGGVKQQDLNLKAFAVEFPTVAVGAGATWEIPVDIDLGEQKLAGTATYVVQAADDRQAQIFATMHFGGSIEESGHVSQVQGEARSTLLWRAGLPVSPDLSGSFSFQFTETRGVFRKHAAPSGCIQMQISTRSRPAA